MKFDGLKEKLKKAGAETAIYYLAKNTQSKEFLGDLLKDKLDEYLNGADPADLKICFDENCDFVKGIDEEMVTDAKKYIKSDNPDVHTIVKNIEEHMYYFDEKWVMEFLSEKHPEFYSIIMTDAKTKEFQKYMSIQVHNVIKYIQEEVLGIKTAIKS